MQAARRAAKRLHGRRAQAVRLTGERGKSGVFGAYVPVPARLGGGQTSVGGPFHIAEL
jgi:hypothetical protein